jgi:predicted AAA+ superfamily ATPase
VRQFPALVVTGGRQTGKTTLARISTLANVSG